MQVRRRTLYVRQPDDNPSRSLFGRVLADLHRELRRITGHTASFSSWPTVYWDVENCRVETMLWTAEENPDERLLEASLTLRTAAAEWSLKLTIGCSQPEEVVVCEVCHAVADAYPSDLLNAPTLLDFLAEFPASNEDSLDANRVYTVAKNRAGALADFICAPLAQRRLPIVLLSPTVADRVYFMTPRELIRPLRGMAHIMTLTSRASWYSSDLPIEHACYNGAVRIYMPGYAASDAARDHRFWHPERIQELGAQEVLAEIVFHVHERMALIQPENALLAMLMGRRDQEILQRRVRSQVESARQRLAEEAELLSNRLRAEVEAESERERETFFEEIQRSYQELVDEYDRLTIENTRLHQEIRIKEDEIRGLRYRLSEQWSKQGSSAPANTDVLAAPRLHLSQQAWTIFEQLDNGVRQSIETQILTKLCDDELRNAQREPIASRTGTAFVYPRSRSADGRRVIFREDAHMIMVCELFSNHDDYEKVRDRGIDLDDYQEFTPWPNETSGDALVHANVH